MTWPAPVNTTNADAGTDNPQVWRADALDLSNKFNQLRAHVTTFMQGLLAAADAPAARSLLGNVPVVAVDGTYPVGCLLFGRHTNVANATTFFSGTITLSTDSTLTPCAIGVNGTALQQMKVEQGAPVSLDGSVWRCLGYSVTGAAREDVTLWQRIS